MRNRGPHACGIKTRCQASRYPMQRAHFCRRGALERRKPTFLPPLEREVPFPFRAQPSGALLTPMRAGRTVCRSCPSNLQQRQRRGSIVACGQRPREMSSHNTTRAEGPSHRASDQSALSSRRKSSLRKPLSRTLCRHSEEPSDYDARYRRTISILTRALPRFRSTVCCA